MDPLTVASFVTSASIIVLAVTQFSNARWLARVSRQLTELQYGLAPGTLDPRATPGRRPGGGSPETQTDNAGKDR